MTFDPNIVPDKFKTPEGAVNVQALTQSAEHVGLKTADYVDAQGQIDITKLSIAYREKEAAQSKPAPAPNSVAATKIDTEQPSSPDQIDFASLQYGPDGRIVPADRQKLASAGIAEGVLQEWESGRAARAEVNVLRLANTLPNGMNDYNDLITWANAGGIDAAERERMAQALNGPAGDKALRGYWMEYQDNKAQTGEPNLSGINTTGTVNTGTNEGLQPFMSWRDRTAAYKDHRYGTDVEYTDIVHARARLTSQAVAEQQRLQPTPGWRGHTK